jgi:hypothetical protein
MATVKSDNSGPIFKAIREALKLEVLVGIPDTAAERKPEPGQKGTPPSNAVIGYLMEYGDAQMNLPARPFLLPGVQSMQGTVPATLAKGIEGVFLGKADAYKKALDQVGLAAQVAVKAKMIDGGFAPLSDRTIEAHARRKNADTGKLKQDGRSRDARSFLKLRAEGVPDEVLHDADLAKPLLDTFSLYTSIQYVIRDKRDRT